MIEVVAQLVTSNVTAILLIAIFLLLFYKTWTSETDLQLPPGPWANHIPLVGFLPFLNKRAFHVVLWELAERYGKVFRVQLGGQSMVVISCPQLFRDTFKREEMIYINHGPVINQITDGHGISTAQGPFWKTQRHFALTTLRDLGMLRSNTANREQFKETISSAINILLREVENSNGKPFDMSNLLSFTVANVFFSTITSKTYDLCDAKIRADLEEIHDSFKLIENIAIVSFLPIFAHLPSIKKDMKTLLGRRDGARNFFREIIAQHRATLDTENPRDFVDAFLIQIDREKTTNGKTSFTEIQLLAVLADLYSAGTATTVAALRWMFLALAKNQHIQEKVQKELDETIGRSRCPSIEDRTHLPYMEAVIHEVLRMSSLFSTGVPHCPRQDIIIENYRIPKGTLICGLLWKFHQDPALWKNPNDFDPENFIGEDGNFIKQHDCLMPFSYGRRSCIGEEIAKQEIFLIAASLLQKFTFLPPEGKQNLPSFEDTVEGFLRSPVPYQLKATLRISNQ